MQKITLAVRIKGKFVPILYFQDKIGREHLEFLGAQGLQTHKVANRMIMCGDKRDANGIAEKFASCTNKMHVVDVVTFVNSVQKLPVKVKEFLKEQIRKL